MFKFRIISFPLLLALLGYMIFGGVGGKVVFKLIAPLMVAGSVYELLAMLQNGGAKSFPRFSAIVILIFCELIAFGQLYLGIGLACGMFMIFFFGMLVIKEDDRMDYIAKGMMSVGGSLLALVCFVPMIFLFDMNSINLFFLILTTKMMDTGGYVFGMTSNIILPGGNHKILPTISPKKSYEGTIGGILLSVAAGYVLWKYNCAPWESLKICLLASVIFAIGSFLGDLTESAIKRCCKVKDSGNIIPGMGGVFDVLDSFIFNGVLFFVIEKLVKLLG